MTSVSTNSSLDLNFSDSVMDYIHVALTFPSKLFMLLEVMEKQDMSVSPIRWNDDGKSFKILKKNEFCEILPQFFKQRKFTSFTRQLNIYDYKQIRNGPLSGSYYHPCFVRGRRELLHEIIRVPIKSEPSKPVASSRSRSRSRSTSKDSFDDVSFMRSIPVESSPARSAYPQASVDLPPLPQTPNTSSSHAFNYDFTSSGMMSREHSLSSCSSDSHFIHSGLSLDFDAVTLNSNSIAESPATTGPNSPYTQPNQEGMITYEDFLALQDIFNNEIEDLDNDDLFLLLNDQQ